MIRAEKPATPLPANALAAPGSPLVAPPVPVWAVPRGPVENAAHAAFLAGAALNSLDNLVRSEPLWAGAWRQRLALKCAAAAIKRAGRTEDETVLRDALLLARPGDRGLGEGSMTLGAAGLGSTSLGSPSLGPAGSILAAWRQLASKRSPLDAGTVKNIVELLGLRWDAAFAALPEQVEALRADAEQAAPFAAAAIAAKIHAARPDAELLAWWLADWMLAQKLRWPRPVPLLMAQVFTPAFRTSDGRVKRIRPGEQKDFERAVCLALARGAADACRLGAEMARRAERLVAIAPKLRAKGAPDAIRLLLDDDAVSGALVTRNLSRFASRRLFERLHSLDAVRELSGRSTFRIYGL